MDRASVLIWVGLLLSIIATILSFSWNSIFNYVIRTELPVSPTSKTYPLWKESVVTMDIYLYNWTNPEKLMERNYKPDIVQLGPYSFKQIYKKINITWNANHTVTYKRVRNWYFDHENSKGNLTDNIIMLNVIPLTASYIVRGWNSFSAFPVSSGVRMFGKTVWITRTAKQLLFDGYDDPLLTIATTVPGLSDIHIPEDKVGWFYNRNGSVNFDGVFNVHTADDDITKMGDVLNWNFADSTNFFDGGCSRVKGSVGDLFPPGQTKDKPLNMFSPDLCRSYQLDFSEEVEVQGIHGFRYEASKTLVDNGTIFPDSWCNCDGDCLPMGVFNLSSCRYGIPLFVSYPHFYGADPFFVKHVKGLSPNAEDHRFYVTLEPVKQLSIFAFQETLYANFPLLFRYLFGYLAQLEITGILLDLKARVQLNILLQPSTNVGLFKNMPTILFPMMWFEERYMLPPAEASLVKLLLALPVFGLYASVALVITGIIILAISILPTFLRSEPWKIPYRIKGKSSEMIAMPQTVYNKGSIKHNEKEDISSPEEQEVLLNSKASKIVIK